MFRKRIGAALITVCLIMAVCIALRFSPLWDRILPAGPTDEISFNVLQPPTTKTNWYLVCPEEYCLRATSSRLSPEFSVPLPELRTEIIRMIEGLPDITIQSRTETALELIARTPLVGWPDRVSISILPSEKGGSTLAIYSRSVYGQSDFGTNKNRIETWLSTLERILPSS